MENDVFLEFLSEEGLARHLELLNNLRLRYSIIEKSIPAIKGKDYREISLLKLSGEIKKE